jgi:hypothetical protein
MGPSLAGLLRNFTNRRIKNSKAVALDPIDGRKQKSATT